MTNSVFLAAALALSAPAAAQSTATLKGVDLYRSRRVDLDKVVTAHQSAIETFLRLRSDGRRGSLKSAERIKGQIEASIWSVGGLAWLRLHYGEYFTSGGRSAYISFEVVDAADAKTRMPFRTPPRAERGDPGGLVEAWGAFADMGNALRQKGEVSSTRPSCPAFYCGWGSQTAEYASYQQRFSGSVSEHKKALVSVLENDANSEKRKSAAYLLAYLKDGEEVVGLMVSALRDPDEDVRAAALDVLADIALYHRGVDLPVKDIVPALDYPATMDRSKALTVLVGLAQNKRYRSEVAKHAGSLCLEHLKLSQPNLHDLAFTVLTLLSSESFDRRDYTSWERWLQLQTKP